MSRSRDARSPCPLRAGARTLAVGSSGPDVLALRARLARLHVQVPAPSTTFGSELFDSVVAFLKARGLKRTGAVAAATILWKALATTTWLGPAILYRTMTFHTHYAIHGFASVPTYPASHGCVRIPIWLADWLYQHSPVGEPVYVYE